MKFFLPVIFIVFILFSFLTTGCNPSSSDSGTATLKGIVVDTSIPSRPRIPYAKIFLEQTNDTTRSDSTGIFTFSNLTGGVYAVYISKPGYSNYSTTVEVIADTTTWLTTPLLFKNIYAFNNIVMDLNNAADFRNGYSVPDNSTDKDIQFRDVVVGPDTLIYLRGGNQDLLGHETWFSNKYIQNYTQFQFDTLSAYRTEDGYINLGRDFPNHNGLDSNINVSNYKHSVWFFYLVGRWPGPGISRIYGTMYLDSAWYDAGLNLRRIRVDIKINTNEINSFNPYNKK
ncbi:MAG: carboxypeptidase regulatory-like domain-containing protein [Ignavibacteriae bacterium]|nr:carboxypeptidase regulatory-like domain-containing protein [Ignavibacteriota bacterium]